MKEIRVYELLQQFIASRYPYPIKGFPDMHYHSELGEEKGDLVLSMSFLGRNLFQLMDDIKVKG